MTFEPEGLLTPARVLTAAACQRPPCRTSKPAVPRSASQSEPTERKTTARWPPRSSAPPKTGPPQRCAAVASAVVAAASRSRARRCIVRVKGTARVMMFTAAPALWANTAAVGAGSLGLSARASAFNSGSLAQARCPPAPARPGGQVSRGPRSQINQAPASSNGSHSNQNHGVFLAAAAREIRCQGDLLGEKLSRRSPVPVRSC